MRSVLRFGGGIILGLALVGGLFSLAVAGPPPGATAADLLGTPMPASVRAEQLAIERRGLGAYRAYLRLVVDPADVPALLAEAVVQPPPPGDQPWAVFTNATVGGRPLVAEVLPARPPWWRPEDGPPGLRAYRSSPGPGAGGHRPDAAWYIVDTRDPAQAVVHIYVLEV